MFSSAQQAENSGQQLSKIAFDGVCVCAWSCVMLILLCTDKMELLFDTRNYTKSAFWIR